MTSVTDGEPDKSPDEVWEVLGLIRNALEGALPPGWIRPADETPRVVSAEVEAIIMAIHEMAIVIPAEELVDRAV
ncbi:hypothetical protein [Acidisoma silvae]|uniref:Uncharacterized protein n=1 Tax=Acidisoma silvae TaxID=2802396 RepID=A0A964E1Y7_9PROT|nr:hypothetical protein [Acidisoma silvae]MCB8878268.1 hypothetical protein [Acidisoma silvae]